MSDWSEIGLSFCTEVAKLGAMGVVVALIAEGLSISEKNEISLNAMQILAMCFSAMVVAGCLSTVIMMCNFISQGQGRSQSFIAED